MASEALYVIDWGVVRATIAGFILGTMFGILVSIVTWFHCGENEGTHGD